MSKKIFIIVASLVFVGVSTHRSYCQEQIRAQDRVWCGCCGYDVGERIGIMGALHEEVMLLLDFLKNHRTVVVGGRTYYLATYKGLNLFIVESGVGKVNASLTSTTLIETFAVHKIIFTGVAGALNPTYQIGDLVAAIQLCQHDIDITALGFPPGLVPGGQIYTNASAELLAIADQVAADKGIDLKKGIVATGDQFVADIPTKTFIRSTFNGDAVEMEGGAVAAVCTAFNIPFFVLRAISDTADLDSPDDFFQFLQQVAQVSSSFVTCMLDIIAQELCQTNYGCTCC